METQSCNHPFEIYRIAEFRRNSKYTKNAKNVVDINENCEAIQALPFGIAEFRRNS